MIDDSRVEVQGLVPRTQARRSGETLRWDEKTSSYVPFRISPYKWELVTLLRGKPWMEVGDIVKDRRLGFDVVWRTLVELQMEGKIEFLNGRAGLPNRSIGPPASH